MLRQPLHPPRGQPPRAGGHPNIWCSSSSGMGSSRSWSRAGRSARTPPPTA